MLSEYEKITLEKIVHVLETGSIRCLSRMKCARRQTALWSGCLNWQSKEGRYSHETYRFFLIVGTGAAGLFCALQIPSDKQVLMITKEDADESDSFLARAVSVS